MSLTMPKYIERAGVAVAAIRYTWTDPDSFEAFMGDERLANRIRKISPRGVVAFSAATAEWIAWRLSEPLGNGIMLNYLEAVWAGIIDWRYMRPRKAVPGAPYLVKDWKGKTRGPILKACNDVDEVIGAAKKGRSAGLSSSVLSQLALHVLPEEPYKDWRRFAINRLAEMYPASAGELGPPVPREALDPDVDFRPQSANRYLATFLENLDPSSNPFLKTPAEMRAEGFEAVPYQL